MSGSAGGWLWWPLFWAAIGGLLIPLLCQVARSLGRSGPVNALPIHPPGDGQLEAVEGIGPQIAELLRAKDISGFADLAGKSPGELRRILAEDPKFLLAETSSWPLQAHLLATGRFDEFLRLAVALNAGVPRLEDIEGIGTARADALRGAGIASIGALIERKSDETASIAAVSAEEADRWHTHARRLYDGDRDSLLKLAGLDRLALLPLPPGPLSLETGDGSPLGRRLWQPGRYGSNWCAPMIATGLLGILFVAWLFGWSLKICDCPPPKVNPTPVCPPTPPPPRPVRKNLEADNLFDSGQHVLTDEGRALLDGLVEELSGLAAKSTHLPAFMVITGHADRMPFRGPNGNQVLSEQRAGAVAAYLRGKISSRIPDPEKWPSKSIFSYGLGSTMPFSGDNTAIRCTAAMPRTDLITCLAKDRRVEVRAYFFGAATSDSGGGIK